LASAYDSRAHLFDGIGNPVSVASFAAAQLLRALPRVRLSRAVGRLCEQPLSPPLSRLLQGAYVRAYGVNMDEAASRTGSYPCFDAFFTRSLRDGIRPIERDVVVSPADGAIQATGPIDPGGRIFVKGRPYEVGELVGDYRDAGHYARGSFAVIYLSPRDYHRVHSPVEGTIRLVRGMPGDLFPVNSVGERHVRRLLVRNHRVAIVIDTVSRGRVTVVMVGAMIVGRITVNALPGLDNPTGVHRIEPPDSVQRGDEIGTFHLGSSVVLLLGPGTKIARATGPVRYGQSLTKVS
jgi:phosphatidylserine decarboxylase